MRSRSSSTRASHRPWTSLESTSVAHARPDAPGTSLALHMRAKLCHGGRPARTWKWSRAAAVPLAVVLRRRATHLDRLLAPCALLGASGLDAGTGHVVHLPSVSWRAGASASPDAPEHMWRATSDAPGTKRSRVGTRSTSPSRSNAFSSDLRVRDEAIRNLSLIRTSPRSLRSAGSGCSRPRGRGGAAALPRPGTGRPGGSCRRRSQRASSTQRDRGR